ncbi:glycosyltransferase [Bacillus sp. JJ1521]|uniref:glycosyltransferase n=1 Tax=Bacillus sp. JJ1521 TaxID=3122957 RepID=UPI002FFF045D
MKKIVIVTRKMIMGGIEKALISMLNTIPKDKYEVTVLVMGAGGELEEELPDHVKVKCLYGYEKTTLEKIGKHIKNGRFIHAFKIGWYTILTKMTKNVFKQEWFHSKMIPMIESEYDIAIAYHVPASFPVVFVMENIKAKSKIAWIHADVSHYVNELKPYERFYERYEKIFCVSNYGMKKFIELYPHLQEKTSVFYNILDKKQITLLAEKDEGFNDGFDGIRILTVGRLTKEKGHDILPSLLMKLREEGNNVRWYCIGDGESRLELEILVKKHNLEEHFILLGTKRNPYPYIKGCDIYVQPSRHEGYCISLAEARAFNKPIITTDFLAAREQIVNGQNGLIVNFDENEIFKAVKTLISNQDLCEKFVKNLMGGNLESTETKKIFDCVG